MDKTLNMVAQPVLKTRANIYREYKYGKPDSQNVKKAIQEHEDFASEDEAPEKEETPVDSVAPSEDEPPILDL